MSSRREEEKSQEMQWHMRPGGVRSLWDDNLPKGASGLAWLGQAGFGLRLSSRRLFIDPYLSDILSEKYRGTEFPHTRMIAPPVIADSVRNLDWVLCSHRHTDHMDSGSLPLLARNNPQCQFIVPRAEREAAIKAGVPPERMLAVNSGETISLSPELTVSVLASAHETLKTNEAGEHHFLGFVLKTPHLVLYHSGDCVPYEGLAEELHTHRIDIALLPVNGRDVFRSSRSVPGNMTFAEASDICSEGHIHVLIPHHFGMFAFNTIDPAELWQQAAGVNLPLVCLPPTLEHYFVFESVAKTKPEQSGT